MRKLLSILLATIVATSCFAGDAVREIEGRADGSVAMAVRMDGVRFLAPAADEAIVQLCALLRVPLPSLPEGAHVAFNQFLKAGDLDGMKSLCASDADREHVDTAIAPNLAELSARRRDLTLYHSGRVTFGGDVVLFPEAGPRRRLQVNDLRPLMPVVARRVGAEYRLSFDYTIDGSALQLVSAAVGRELRGNQLRGLTALDFAVSPNGAIRRDAVAHGTVHLNLQRVSPAVALLKYDGPSADLAFMKQVLITSQEQPKATAAFVAPEFSVIPSNDDKFGWQSLASPELVTVVGRQAFDWGTLYLYRNGPADELHCFWVFVQNGGVKCSSMVPNAGKPELGSLYINPDWLTLLASAL